MKGLGEVAQIVGLTRRQIQVYEEKGLAKKPQTKNKYGYLQYSEQEIKNLWRLRFYKELGYKINDIKEILKKTNSDQREELKIQIKELEKKKNDLDNLINVAKSMLDNGSSIETLSNYSFYFEDVSFDTTMTLFAPVIKVFEELEDVKEPFIEVFTEEDLENLSDILDEIIRLKNDNVSFDSKDTQDEMYKLYQISSKALSPSIFVHSWILNLLDPKSEIGEEIINYIGIGRANYFRDALETFVINHKNNDYDRKFLEGSLNKIANLAVKKYSTNSKEVQAEVDKFYQFFVNIRIINEEVRNNFFKACGDFFNSKEYKQIIDNGNEKGISWFCSRAIHIYIENLKKRGAE